jgi:hypothetical protein
MLHSTGPPGRVNLPVAEVQPRSESKPDRETPHTGMAGTRQVSLPTQAIAGFGRAI